MADQTTESVIFELRLNGEQGLPKPTTPTTYTAADCTHATRRCAELAVLNPKWPQARVRKTVAREMGVRTTTLRYLLRQGVGV